MFQKDFKTVNLTVFISDISVGDLNADGMDDLYCHTNDGNTTVAKSTVKGKYSCSVVIMIITKFQIS